jgi:aryl-alcohol dehydrogenase-like predicted oxidoreductase
MNYRTLGRTGLRVSEVGQGMGGMGLGWWRDADDAESRRALRLAFDGGVNFFDTALVYGNGHAESLVGELARAVGRDQVLIATKIPPANLRWPAPCGVPAKEAFPPAHVRASTEKSLRNLKVDHIDVQQLHVWQDAWLEEPDWLEELHKLRKEGKIRFLGASINDHDPESAMLLAQQGAVDVLQVIYNLFDRSPEEALFPLAAESGVGIIARCPLDEGGLSGKITPETVFPPGDFRERYFAGDRKAEVHERVKKLEKSMGSEASSVPELALRFCLSSPQVATAIPGMRKEAHVRANLAVSDGRLLSAAALERLKEHAWPRNFYL